MKLIGPVLLMSLTAACSNTDGGLSISDVEKNGFKKENQQLYQMVGAIDGWSGIWEGEIVEVYQFEDSSSVKLEYFETITDSGNISNWKDKCQFKNLYLISKGNRACLALNNIKI
ncbi:hypothetical protein [Marinagarivorans cellulosilyticus]|uniref:Lipoprotein n=1 Tax=Marinagarivorans cellulosilyticus TaxID=2721545 RepID=A0AAN1WHI6_9GAMM|nr:hypothetical protein [Marinagarivorans cellulosilyticus]BCD97718.1 hypothetical protein MARGE09_P1919 [Marinagarivorans cellulosilyticus]